MEDLKQYLERYAVVPSATNAGTPAETVQEITRRMGEATGVCIQALNLGGLELQALMEAVATRWAAAHLSLRRCTRKCRRPTV